MGSIVQYNFHIYASSYNHQIRAPCIVYKLSKRPRQPAPCVHASCIAQPICMDVQYAMHARVRAFNYNVEWCVLLEHPIHSIPGECTTQIKAQQRGEVPSLSSSPCHVNEKRDVHTKQHATYGIEHKAPFCIMQIYANRYAHNGRVFVR